MESWGEGRRPPADGDGLDQDDSYESRTRDNVLERSGVASKSTFRRLTARTVGRERQSEPRIRTEVGTVAYANVPAIHAELPQV